MRQYLLDANVLGAYLKERPGAVRLTQTWIHNNEATTSVVVYGELIEYIKALPDYVGHQRSLRALLRKVHTYPLTYAILERYAEIRRATRPPYRPGLIGDMDTLIAATAIQHGLILVTTDSDFARVPGLLLKLLHPTDLRN